MPTQEVTYSREHLYVELWNEPATTVAKRYEISSNALGKICERLDVPVPPRGYWKRRSLGAIDPTPPLSKSRGEVAITVVRKGRRPDRERVEEARDVGRLVTAGPIVVPDVLDHPHPLVAEARELLARGTTRNGLVSAREQGLDVVVSPQLVDRALRIMNTLILALEERGLPVEVTPGETNGDVETRTLVNGEWIRIAIVERLRQHRDPPPKLPRKLNAAEREFCEFWNRPRMQLIPSGSLILSIKEPDTGVRISWQDEPSRHASARRPVEGRLNDFVKQLFVVAEAKKQARAADSEWRAVFEVEAARKRAEREHAAQEAERVRALRSTVARWKEARDVRELVQELRSAKPGAPVPEWLSWAEAYAESIDPIGVIATITTTSPFG